MLFTGIESCFHFKIFINGQPPYLFNLNPTVALETQTKAPSSTANITFLKTHSFHCLLSSETNCIIAFAIVAVFLFSKKEF